MMQLVTVDEIALLIRRLPPFV